MKTLILVITRRTICRFQQNKIPWFLEISGIFFFFFWGGAAWALYWMKIQRYQLISVPLNRTKSVYYIIFLKQCVPRTSYHGYCCYFEVVICLSFCKEENNCKYITLGTRRSQLLASIQMDTLVSWIHDKLPMNSLIFYIDSFWRIHSQPWPGILSLILAKGWSSDSDLTAYFWGTFWPWG